MNSNLIRLLFFTVLIVAIQAIFLFHLTIFGATADLVFVLSLWIATRFDRTTTLISVALAAFFQDALGDSWGVHLISKTLFVYLFFPLGKRIQDSVLSIPQIFLVILIAGAVYQFMLLSVAGFSGQFTSGNYFWTLWLAGSMYTAFVGTIAYLFQRN